jgi:hypothetical protein
MKPTLHRVLRILAIGSYLVVNLHPTFATDDGLKSEFVRLSYLEGDVRVSEGSRGRVELGDSWVKPLTGFPIRAGMTLATGTGRAEIEFENGWTAYLAEQSTLEFVQLELSANDVPQTKLYLLTGTMSIDFRPEGGEKLGVETSFGGTLRFSDDASMRLGSFLDGLSVTAIGAYGVGVETGRNTEDDYIYPGFSIAYVKHNAIPGHWSPTESSKDWDNWVSTRITERDSILTAAMKDSGLSEPVMGLADLYTNGKFFDCEDGGKCWAPNTPANALTATADAAMVAQAALQTGPSIPGATAGQQPGSPAPGRYVRYLRHYPGPNCTNLTETVERDTDTGKERAINLRTDDAPWAFPLCHAGSFSYHRHRGYVWVAGRKHHHPPCHWVKYRGHDGYVPRSWRDTPGKPPANLKNGVLISATHVPGKFEFLQVNDLRPVSTLRSEPKEFGQLLSPQLAQADRPQIQAHLFLETLHTANTKEPVAPITFDFVRRSFVSEAPVTDGRENATKIIGQMNAHGAFKEGPGAIPSYGVGSKHRPGIVSGFSSASVLDHGASRGWSNGQNAPNSRGALAGVSSRGSVRNSGGSVRGGSSGGSGHAYGGSHGGGGYSGGGSSHSSGGSGGYSGGGGVVHSSGGGGYSGGGSYSGSSGGSGSGGGAASAGGGGGRSR